MSVYIFTTLSSIKLVIITYLVNNLHTDVLLDIDILIKEEINIDLKRKKLTIEYRETDLVFKTLSNSTDMHIITQCSMHKILYQQQLNYDMFMKQFQVKTSSQQVKSSVSTITSKLQTEFSLKFALFCHFYFTVDNLYTQFHLNAKTTLSVFISI